MCHCRIGSLESLIVLRDAEFNLRHDGIREAMLERYAFRIVFLWNNTAFLCLVARRVFCLTWFHLKQMCVVVGVCSREPCCCWCFL